MLQLVLSPRRGWEDIAADDVDSQELMRRGFVPLVAITSALSLLSMVYHSGATWTGAVEGVIACFVKFLASYYIATFFFSLYIPSCTGGVMRPNKNNTFIIYSLGLLVMLNLLFNCLPMVPDMLYLLPVYVMFIMWRGIEYMEVKFNGVLQFVFLSGITLIVIPFLLQYLFNLVIPD